MKLIMLICAVCVVVTYSQRIDAHEASVVKNADGAYNIIEGKDPNALASGSFSDGLLVNGWGILEIESNAHYDDVTQIYAAGLLEGYLTANQISNHAAVVMNGSFPDYKNTPDSVLDFYSTQQSWVENNILAHGHDTTSFWSVVALIQYQYQGLLKGYSMAVTASDGGLPELDEFTFQALNGIGDSFQIFPAVEQKYRIPWHKLKKLEAEKMYYKRTHCSALIKVTGMIEDLYFGHSSWFEFYHTNRIYKTYKFPLTNPMVVATQTSFSSYPGYLESLDDFYIMDSGIAVTQTSNDLLTTDLYDQIKPQSLLAWQRMRLANLVASTGQEWYSAFSFEHSGTYVNQYMVVNTNLFEPGKPLQDGLLTVVEEIPGLVLVEDATQQLERGYWPSYNIPYFKEIWEKSGYKDMYEKDDSQFWSYDLAPRANIFRRDQGTVVDLDSFKAILRYNNYTNDPYSFNGQYQDANYAICSRGDLNTRASYGGCYDTKVSSYNYGLREGKASILNGPTTSSGLPPFSWADAPSDIVHQGLPETYDFDWLEVHTFD